jgi:hypothetical protein
MAKRRRLPPGAEAIRYAGWMKVIGLPDKERLFFQALVHAWKSGYRYKRCHK